ncbi:Hypothetical predicted protein, partial [Marmota monax]
PPAFPFPLLGHSCGNREGVASASSYSGWGHVGGGSPQPRPQGAEQGAGLGLKAAAPPPSSVTRGGGSALWLLSCSGPVKGGCLVRVQCKSQGAPSSPVSLLEKGVR